MFEVCEVFVEVTLVDVVGVVVVVVITDAGYLSWYLD